MSDKELELGLERWVVACEKEGLPTDPSIKFLSLVLHAFVYLHLRTGTVAFT